MSTRWSAYVLACDDGSLRTGVTTNIESRVCARRDAGGGAAHRPVALLYQENGFTRAQAVHREAELKAMRRAEKEKLLLNVAAMNRLR